jgi:hypothetical protein
VSAILTSGQYRLVRRISSAQWAADYDPTEGALPPLAQWATVGEAQSLGLMRFVGVFVDGSDAEVPGGTYSYRVVEPAPIDIVTGASGINVNGTPAVAVWSDEITGASAGEVQIVDAQEAGYITITVADVDPPAGATQLLIFARKV